MSRKILIVDDEELILKFLVRKLSKLGYGVDYAGDGLTAIDKLNEFKPDLIIMDIAMPSMDGLDTIRFIRNELNNCVPIVAISAKAFEVDIQEGLRAGANIYLTKPIKFHEMMEAITEFVK